MMAMLLLLALSLASARLGTQSTTGGKETVFVHEFTDGRLDPELEFLGPVKSGGHIIANTAPGCWGPMITPHLKGGHEVTMPVAVAGAEIGDAVALKIKNIEITSLATASGNDYWVDGRFQGDPYCAAYHARKDGTGEFFPETYVDGIGEDAIKYVKDDSPATPFKFANGYTMAFDSTRKFGVTVTKEAAEIMAVNAKDYHAMPENSTQHSILTFAPAHLVGLVSRTRPFMGQLGSCPAIALPDSHNAGDFGSFLIGAPHPSAVTAEDLLKRTDGHMDINTVRAGAVLVVPCKVQGCGLYFGDMHAMQGDGEIAGHTTDVSGTITAQVTLIKGLTMDGPLIFPNLEDLPFLAKPLTPMEKKKANDVVKQWNLPPIEDSLPIAVVGTGASLNDATQNGLQRAADLFQVDVPEIKNRATITGAVEIGRAPGVVTVTLRVPREWLDTIHLLDFATDQYVHDDL
eukprot:CAMPEP_0118914332 /NCGR_PEP_ID=MMETSP1166-20130328/14728_1 /TAXON_ID=1104430 /ORGANISM="Chrysoreinhardia sp, Strain CCMP3193" /LENGTH=459 /DNA_ID=CAMNT_0006853909 /DNA_START=26 /DNA_END=1405 /DNA_ORIENTATION=+